MDEIKTQLPNVLTIARIILAVVCIYFAFESKINSLVISLVLFCLASLTDYFDGYLARKWKKVSAFGKLMDPIADKILILGVFFVFAFQGIVPMILTVLIFIREITLTIIRLAISSKVVLASRYSGKVKTFSQIIALLLIYTILIFKPELVQLFSYESLMVLIKVIMVIVVFISLYSGYDFLKHNRKVVSKELKLNI